MTANLLKQGHQYHTLGKAFSKIYRRHSELIVKYNAGLETFPQKCVSEPVLLIHLKKIAAKPSFHDQFKKVFKHNKTVGYSMDVMRQSAYLIITHSKLIAMIALGVR